MKTSLITVFCFIVSGFSAVAVDADHPLLKVKEEMQGSYYSGGLPEGFSDKKLEKKPRFTRSLARYFSRLERQKKREWKEFVWSSEEFHGLTHSELDEIAKDPKEYLDAPYLVEIEEVHALYKNGKHIGYVYECFDHVEGAIIQDGAGIVIYADPSGKVIATDEWTA